ncbi:MAG: nitronate monooxygenase [Planctomycetota bacterium]|nr:MAG: nitronate monooxygenase [Planctomycetota bacterium]
MPESHALASSTTAAARALPALIQGGMGIGVSSWRLARAVSQAGALGVVSGSALDRVLAYRLQEGDAEGHLRRALAAFPLPDVAQALIEQWFQPAGLSAPGAYRQPAMIDHQPRPSTLGLVVAANFVEVWLAKENHQGPVGINLLEKSSAANLASLYGALLAGVDAVLMGAGIPKDIPAALDALAAHQPAQLPLMVEGALPGERFLLHFDPASVGALAPDQRPALRRPPFLAVISSDVLAQSLHRSTAGAVDGFVVERHSAGGHNAPPRGARQNGEALTYGPRDEADLERLLRLERPFWLAGSQGYPGALAAAQKLGAQGIQVGTAFAQCQESGLLPELKSTIHQLRAQGKLCVDTDPTASPTGFPFKVADVPDTLSEADRYEQRQRICNQGFLRQAYRREDGRIGWRCPAEPAAAYIAKGGQAEDCAGRKCLCNALLAAIGHPQAGPNGELEAPLVTAGDCLAWTSDSEVIPSAADIIGWLSAVDCQADKQPSGQSY